MSHNSREHSYQIDLRWVGNRGPGTANYRAYARDHEIAAPGKTAIAGSSDPKFRGDASRYNPEELLVASLSACHMLWYLHLCSESGIVVNDYQDAATGSMVESDDGGGHFTSVTLRPAVRISDTGKSDLAMELHDRAHHLCFIASSVKFPVLCEPSVEVE